MAIDAERRILHIVTDDLGNLKNTQIGIEENYSGDDNDVTYLGNVLGVNDSSGNISRYAKSLEHGYFNGIYMANTDVIGNISISSLYGINNSTSMQYVRISGGTPEDVIRAKYGVDIGIGAGLLLPSGSGLRNVNIGFESGYHTLGDECINIGNAAGEDANTGYGVNIGYKVAINCVGDKRINIGYQAGNNSDGDGSICIGTDSGYNADNTHTTTVSIGYKSDYHASTQSYTSGRSVLLGGHSGYESEGVSRTYVGYEAGYEAIGVESIAVGYRAGKGSKGGLNILLGYQAGGTDLIGDANILIGTQSGMSSHGSHNIIIGGVASISIRGNHNICIGSGSGGTEESTYENCVFIGGESKLSNETHNGVVYGYEDNFRLSTDTGILLSGNFVTGRLNIEKVLNLTPIHTVDILPPCIGDMIYDLTDSIPKYYDGTWKEFGGAGVSDFVDLNDVDTGSGKYPKGGYHILAVNPGANGIAYTGIGISGTSLRVSGATVDILTINSDGTVSLPNCDVTDITDNKDIVTKEYVTNNAGSPSQGLDNYLNASEGDGTWRATDLHVNWDSGEGAGTSLQVNDGDFTIRSNNHGIKLSQNIGSPITAPYLDTASIDAGGDLSLVTKKYVDDSNPSQGVISTLNSSNGEDGWDAHGVTLNGVQLQGSDAAGLQLFSDSTTSKDLKLSGGIVTIGNDAIGAYIEVDKTNKTAHFLGTPNMASEDSLVTKKYVDDNSGGSNPSQGVIGTLNSSNGEDGWDAHGVTLDGTKLQGSAAAGLRLFSDSATSQNLGLLGGVVTIGDSTVGAYIEVHKDDKTAHFLGTPNMASDNSLITKKYVDDNSRIAVVRTSDEFTTAMNDDEIHTIWVESNNGYQKLLYVIASTFSNTSYKRIYGDNVGFSNDITFDNCDIEWNIRVNINSNISLLNGSSHKFIKFSCNYTTSIIVSSASSLYYERTVTNFNQAITTSIDNGVVDGSVEMEFWSQTKGTPTRIPFYIAGNYETSITELEPNAESLLFVDGSIDTTAYTPMLFDNGFIRLRGKGMFSSNDIGSYSWRVWARYVVDDSVYYSKSSLQGDRSNGFNFEIVTPSPLDTSLIKRLSIYVVSYSDGAGLVPIQNTLVNPHVEVYIDIVDVD